MIIVNENKIINTLEYNYHKISLYQWFDSVLGIMTSSLLDPSETKLVAQAVSNSLSIYLLLTEFEVCTVSYGPSRGKTRIRNLQYGPRNEVSKIFIISLFCVWGVRERFLFTTGTASKVLKQVESKTNQFEIVFKSLALFSTQFNVKESFKLLLAIRVKKFGDKSRNSLVTNKTLNFSGPCRRVRLAKLTNHSARSNLKI